VSAASQERALERVLKERQCRRLEREAYASVYRRVARLVPVVLPLAGEVHAFPIEGDVDALMEALRPTCVFGFETALQMRSGRRMLNGSDVHAYTRVAAPPPSLVGAEVAASPLVPVLPRRPYLFLVSRDPLPPSVETSRGRVVSDDWMLREYLGAIGHRFDLLSAVLHHMGADA